MSITTTYVCHAHACPSVVRANDRAELIPFVFPFRSWHLRPHSHSLSFLRMPFAIPHSLHSHTPPRYCPRSLADTQVKDLFCRYKDASSLDQKSTLVNTSERLPSFRFVPTSQADVETRPGLVIRELALHSEAEEATVYNSLQKFSEKDAEHLRHEHQELEESLKDVDLTKVDAPDFSQSESGGERSPVRSLELTRVVSQNSITPFASSFSTRPRKRLSLVSWRTWPRTCRPRTMPSWRLISSR